MAIDLLALEPTVITRDLSNKYILLAAPVKYGKTTFMCNIPGAVILSFEPGLNAHAGVYAQTITTWSEVKQVVRQLKDPKVREKFHTVCFDTVDLAASLCQDFVCAQAGVQSLSDVPYGKLYKVYELEFQKTLLAIANLGYGMVFACHTEEKEYEVGDEKKVIARIQPKLEKRAFAIVNRLVDIIGIGIMEFDENGEAHHVLYTRETPTICAGNRFTYFPSKIEFSYQAVLDNLIKAIEAEGTNNNATIVDKIDKEIKEINFEELSEEAKDLWIKNLEKGQTDEEKQEIRNRILKKIEITFGRKIERLSDITEDQAELLELAVLEMKNMLK